MSVSRFWRFVFGVVAAVVGAAVAGWLLSRVLERTVSGVASAVASAVSEVARSTGDAVVGGISAAQAPFEVPQPTGVVQTGGDLPSIFDDDWDLEVAVDPTERFLPTPAPLRDDVALLGPTEGII